MKLTRLTFPTSHNECEFFCNEEQTVFYKSCQRKDLYSTYRDAFELEYSCMHELEKDMGTEAYRKFFPVYKKCYVRKKDGKPYISMEYLQGESLESVLDHMKDSRYPEPRDFFSPEQLFHLCQQIYDMLCCLYKHGIVYLDLSLGNILVTNLSCYDIKLVDFTLCGRKKIDNRMQPDCIPSLSLPYAMMLFFTRLFYSDNDSYSDRFHTDPELSGETYAFFHNRFGTLLGNLFVSKEERQLLMNDAIIDLEAADNPLIFLEKWHSRLQRKLLLLQKF